MIELSKAEERLVRHLRNLTMGQHLVILDIAGHGISSVTGLASGTASLLTKESDPVQVWTCPECGSEAGLVALWTPGLSECMNCNAVIEA